MILRQFGGVAFARGLSSLSQAILLVLVARGVGPSQFGVLATFLSLHIVLFSLGSLNATTLISREYATGNHGFVVTALRINAVALSGVFVLVGSLGLFLIDDPRLLIAVSGNAVAVLLENTAEARLAIAFARKTVSAPTLSVSVRAALTISIYLLLFFGSVDLLVAYGVARTGGAIVGNLIAVLCVRTELSVRRAPTWSTLAMLVPLATAKAMGSLRNLDNVVVSATSGALAVGLYSAVSKVLAPFSIVPNALNSIVIPRAARADLRRVRRYCDIAFYVGVAISFATLGLTPVNEWIVQTVFGPEYAGGGFVLSLVMLRLGVVSVGPVLGGMLQAKRLDRYVAINSTIVAVATLLAVAVCSFLWGPAGAAGGFAGVSLLGFARIWLEGRRRLERGQS
ncbi:hypothetical protein CW368_09295 [Actinomycetales bacterium SN12]|nr:hypothetical protein CW368_09295 [Actinomycetales bacterium SN12]